MKKTVYLLDHLLIPTPYNQRFLIERFAAGFIGHGYEMKVVTRLKEVTEPGFLWLSCHNIFYNNIWGIRLLRMDVTRFLNLTRLFPGPLNNHVPIYSEGILGLIARLLQMWVIKQLAKKKNLITIAWISGLEYDLRKFAVPHLLSGEYYRTEIPKTSNLRAWYDLYRSQRRAIPYPLSANMLPADVGVDCLNEAYDICYIGNKYYQPDYQALFKNNPRARIIPSPPYVAEAERIRIYKNSKISLGLSYQGSIDTGMVTDRIVESLAYGAICLSNNPWAVEATDGNAIYVKDKAELLQKYNFYLNNKSARAELRQRGFEFIRKKGTNYHRAQEFIDRAKELYHPSFLT